VFCQIKTLLFAKDASLLRIPPACKCPSSLHRLFHDFRRLRNGRWRCSLCWKWTFSRRPQSPHRLESSFPSEKFQRFVLKTVKTRLSMKLNNRIFSLLSGDFWDYVIVSFCLVENANAGFVRSLSCFLFRFKSQSWGTI